MKISKIFQVVIMVVCGLAGGIISQILFNGDRAFAQKFPDVVTAKRFVVEDYKGKKVGFFGLLSEDNKTIGMQLADGEGNVGVNLAMTRGGENTLGLRDKNGNLIKIFTHPYEAGGIGSGIIFGNGNSQFLMEISVRNDGSNGVTLYDLNGERRIEIRVPSNKSGGSNGMILYDREGKQRASFSENDNGSSVMNLSDKYGKPRIQAGILPDQDFAGIAINNKDENVIWSAP